ncbi:unnamed protein product [Durusdinium trenchii]|uniref:Uncharacterized protein n=1 Tax=Durusdinium trenchii TaxID=1381693 RepID=A0ABP0SCY1_9DINO
MDLEPGARLRNWAQLGQTRAGFEDALKSLELQASQALLGQRSDSVDPAEAPNHPAEPTPQRFGTEMDDDLTGRTDAVDVGKTSRVAAQAMQIQDAPSGADVTTADTAVATTASADLTQSAELEEAAQIQDAPSGADVTAADTAVALTTASADLTPSAELEEAAQIQDAPSGADVTAADTAVATTASADLTPSAELEEAVQIQDAPSGADVTAADTAVALTTASADLTPAELEEAAHIQDASFGADLTAADTAVDPTASANLTQTEPRACDPEDAVHESAGLGGA